MFKKTLLTTALAFGLGTGGALAAGGVGEIDDHAFSFEGPFGSYDQMQLQRGLQVFHEVCSGCHGISRVYFRNLTEETGPGMPVDQITEFAKNYFVPDDGLEAFPGDEREAKLSDNFPENNGAGAPDLSLMAKARAGFHGPSGTGINQLLKGMGGPEYIKALLEGYQDTPECALDSTIDGVYNAVFPNGGFPDECKYEDGTHKVPGSWISMSQPLWGEDVEYMDGTEATIEQQAADVSAFLMWTAEPKMTQRKQAGLTGVVILGFLTVLLYLTNKKLWYNVKHRTK
ncbi:MAG: cytochrome c1 [Pseudomonadota bacterium]